MASGTIDLPNLTTSGNWTYYKAGNLFFASFFQNDLSEYNITWSGSEYDYYSNTITINLPSGLNITSISGTFVGSAAPRVYVCNTTLFTNRITFRLSSHAQTISSDSGSGLGIILFAKIT